MIKDKFFNHSVGIIISTYNHPIWLEKTLWGYFYQTFKDFEIIIADDGSTEETSNLIKKFTDKTNMKIIHVWHEDHGFQKNKILNKAILATNSEYLIITDQDCIPRKDFVETHLRLAEDGFFLSAGYFRLPHDISDEITKEDIKNQSIFDLKWLHEKGMKYNFKSTKLIKNQIFSEFMNFITTAKPSWNGCNSSCWRSDLIKINGFNEEMKYGGEDREFGERMILNNIKSKQIRYSAICVHLFHKRPYKDDALILKNKEIRKRLKKTKQVITPHGITKINVENLF